MMPNEPSPTPPPSDCRRVVRPGGPDLRVPSAGWLQTVDLITAIAHLPCARWFLSVLVASELADDLRTPGPWTVLVPTDAAVTRWPGGGREAIEALFDPDNAEALIDLAEHHVARGAVRLPRRGPALLATLGGAELRLGPAQAGADHAGLAPVLRPNLRCRNGVIHLLDAVPAPAWVEASLRARLAPQGLDAA